MLPNDDITLSDEHYEYGFFTLEEVLELEDVTEVYKKVIGRCMQKNDDNETKEFGGHGAAGMLPGAPK